MEIEKISEDERGEIWKISSGKKEYFFSRTNKGHARGGDLHDGNQYTLVLEGKVQVRMMFKKDERVEEMGPDDLVVIPKNIPHVFIALEDSVFMEWHELPLPSYEKKRFYEPYRKLCR